MGAFLHCKLLCLQLTETEGQKRPDFAKIRLQTGRPFYYPSSLLARAFAGTQKPLLTKKQRLLWLMGVFLAEFVRIYGIVTFSV